MLLDSVSQRKHILLNLINHLGPISRTALIDLTGFRPATVGAIAAELISDNLIVETESISVGHGRKRVLLDINFSNICALSISFAPNHITMMVAQFDGKVLHSVQMPFVATNPNCTPLEPIKDQIATLLNEFSDRNIVGIGLCKFLFDSMSGISAVDTWIQEKFIPSVETITSLPLHIYSVVTLPAVAEQRFGVAKGKNDFIWVNLTDCINVSLFCNGTAVNGANHLAGQLGHTTLGNSDKLCYCGKPGCLEGSAAWPALEKNIRQAVQDGVKTILKVSDSKIDYWAVREALDNGDRMCRHYVKDAAHKIGLALSNLVNITNPEMIVLHGFMLRLGKQFIQEMEQTIRDNTVPGADRFEVVISNDFENPMLLGAAAEIFSSYLHVDDYRWVYRLSTESRE